MDKKLLNNEIVRMRPDANKAKVHTICKLNREVKRLRVPKDFFTQAQKQKNIKKAERLVEEILLIKKLKHDELSKFAITHSQKAIASIMSKPDSSLESRCLCRVSLHAGLMSCVEKFRLQFPNWESTLVPLIASIGVKEKRKKVMAKNVGLNTNIVLVNKEQEIVSDGINSEEESDIEQAEGNSDDNNLENDQADSDVEYEVNRSPNVYSDTIGKVESNRNSNDQAECDDNYSDQAVSDNNDSDSEEKNGTYLKVYKCKQVNIKVKNKTKGAQEQLSTIDTSGENWSVEHRPPCGYSLSENHDQLKSRVNSTTDFTPESKRKKLTLPKKKKIIDTNNSKNIAKNKVKKNIPVIRSRLMKVMKFTELVGSNTTPIDAPVDSFDETSATLMPKTVDSFFVTEDGKSEFYSTVPTKDPIVDSKPANFIRQEMYDSSGRRLNRREIRSSLHGTQGFKAFPPKPLHKDRSRKWAPPEIQQVTKWKNPVAHVQPKVTLQSVDESLHPSWEAKRKQKEQLNIAFQGKKIKFDD